MAKKYILKKDLPMFKAGDEFHISQCNNLVHTKTGVVAYTSHMLKAFPDILKDWFEEIPDEPKTVWDLKSTDRYFYVNENYVQVNTEIWTNHAIDNGRRECDNCFLTKEEAEKELARRKAKAILERDTKGFKPDWEETSGKDNKWVYTGRYNHMDNKLEVDGYAVCHYACDIWFKTEKDARESIKKHRQEWLTYLGVEE